MMTVFDFTSERMARNPTRYTVHFNHDRDGFWIQAEDLSEDPESKKRLSHYMRMAADMLDAPTP